VVNLWTATLNRVYQAIRGSGRGGSLTATPDAMQQKYNLLIINNKSLFLLSGTGEGPAKAGFLSGAAAKSSLFVTWRLRFMKICLKTNIYVYSTDFPAALCRASHRRSASS
jgi:hypothetical protein